MSGQAHWLTPLFPLIAGLVVGALVFIAHGLGKRYVTYRKRFECPTIHKTVESTMVHDEKTGEWKAITTCSAFDPPENITCGRACVEGMNKQTI